MLQNFQALSALCIKRRLYEEKVDDLISSGHSIFVVSCPECLPSNRKDVTRPCSADS